LPRHLEVLSGLINRESTALLVFAIHDICPSSNGLTIKRGR
jgi:hypothetical protein